MNKSEVNEKRMKAIDNKNFKNVNDETVTTEEVVEEAVEMKRRHKASPYERAAKLAFINTKVYMSLKLVGIVNKKLKDRVNGVVQPNGKPWNDELEIPESMKDKEEEKASVVFGAPTIDNTETTQKLTEEEKKTEEVIEPNVVVTETEAETTSEKEEEPTEMEKVLKPTHNYRNPKGKKARKAAEAAKEAVKKKVS